VSLDPSLGGQPDVSVVRSRVGELPRGVRSPSRPVLIAALLLLVLNAFVFGKGSRHLRALNRARRAVSTPTSALPASLGSVTGFSCEGTRIASAVPSRVKALVLFVIHARSESSDMDFWEGVASKATSGILFIGYCESNTCCRAPTLSAVSLATHPPYTLGKALMHHDQQQRYLVVNKDAVLLATPPLSTDERVQHEVTRITAALPY